MASRIYSGRSSGIGDVDRRCVAPLLAGFQRACGRRAARLAALHLAAARLAAAALRLIARGEEGQELEAEGKVGDVAC